MTDCPRCEDTRWVFLPNDPDTAKPCHCTRTETKDTEVIDYKALAAGDRK